MYVYAYIYIYMYIYIYISLSLSLSVRAKTYIQMERAWLMHNRFAFDPAVTPEGREIVDSEGPLLQMRLEVQTGLLGFCTALGFGLGWGSLVSIVFIPRKLTRA